MCSSDIRKVARDLRRNRSVTAEGDVPLEGEIDALGSKGGDQVGDEVSQTAVPDAVAQHVEGEAGPEQAHGDPGPHPLHIGVLGEGGGQELDQQILPHRDQVAEQKEQAALPDPRWWRSGRPPASGRFRCGWPARWTRYTAWSCGCPPGR